MKKLLMSIVTFCLLAVFVPAVKADAAAPEIKGDLQMGSSVMVEPCEKHNSEDDSTYYEYSYYRVNMAAGQSYYFETPVQKSVSVYYSDDIESIMNSYNNIENYYATANETLYIKVENEENTAQPLTIKPGQTFTDTVTREDGMGNNTYYFTAKLSGEHTFKVTTTDGEADPYISLRGAKKTGYYLKAKDTKSISGYGYHEVTANLQAGVVYKIAVGIEEDAPYTLSLIQSPTVPVNDVKVKKAASPAKKKMKVTWKKAADVSGYEVTYSLQKSMKKVKTKTVSAGKKAVVIKKLKSGKKYFVKVRAFKTVNGTKYYGGYSKVMKVAVK